MKKKPQKSPRLVLTLLLSFFVFCILTLTMMVVGTTVYFLVSRGMIQSPRVEILFITIAIASIILGTVISLLFSKIPTKPINALIDGMNSLAAGDYHVRLELNGPDFGLDVTKSFNLLAEELGNTEMLRSDFVNNFSHEFKTPLVSIRGFAKLLQRENLPEEKKKEYLKIIVSESSRLSELSSRVLDLTRLENQNILTETGEYNLSEQLRECVLLLERKWSEKNLEPELEFGEYSVVGNEEMLKQVWINLLDNAIKFSEPDSALTITVKPGENASGESVIRVSVTDRGPQISEEEKKRIFRKFYQSDTSHTSQGNGIGLAIVKRIVELHDGEVYVDSNSKNTTFTVELPRRPSAKRI